MSRDRRAVRAYGAVVRLYPRSFREEYGPDLVGLFRAQCDDESVTRACGRAALDLALTIPSQHLEAKVHRTNRALVPLLYTALAVAGLALAVIGGTFLPTMIVGLALALGAGTLGVAAWRRDRVSPRTLAGSWWKFLIAAAVLIVAVVVISNLGVEAWLLYMLALLVAFVLGAIGVGLGAAQVLDRRGPQDPPATFPAS